MKSYKNVECYLYLEDMQTRVEQVLNIFYTLEFSFNIFALFQLVHNYVKLYIRHILDDIVT